MVRAAIDPDAAASQPAAIASVAIVDRMMHGVVAHLGDLACVAELARSRSPP
jgi:hypothetical protein